MTARNVMGFSFVRRCFVSYGSSSGLLGERYARQDQTGDPEDRAHEARPEQTVSRYEHEENEAEIGDADDGDLASRNWPPFCSALDRHEVELAVEVHGDYALAALFALVIMDLSRRLRPHGSRPACLPCCSLESMRELALDHDAVIRRAPPVPARLHAPTVLLHDHR